MGSLDPDPVAEGQNMTHRNRIKSINYIFCAGCSLLRAQGFSCSLYALDGGLGINILQFLTKKVRFFQQFFFFSLVIKTLIHNAGYSILLRKARLF
jgi:hypothetical protein